MDFTNMAVNALDPVLCAYLSTGVQYVASKYDAAIEAVRWTLPCVIMGCTLLCLVATSNKTTE